MTDECRDGRLEVYLPSRSVDYPFMSACGHNATALKDLPLLTSKDVEEAAAGSSSAVSSSLQQSAGGGDAYHRRRRRFVHVRFVGTAYPHKAQFKIAWSELNHLPKNSDGTLRTARRTADADANANDCAFSCPGDERLCLADRLVCNGVVNCPGSADDLLNDESPAMCDQWNHRSAASASASAAGDGFGPSAVALFAAVTAAIIVFGVALFAANAYCRRRRRPGSVTSSRRATFSSSNKSPDRIYSTVILLYSITIIVLYYYSAWEKRAVSFKICEKFRVFK